MNTAITANRGSGAPWRSEFAALIALGLPMAATQLVQFSVLTIDVLMIGRLGAEALAASSLGIVMFFFGWLIGFGPVTAVSPLVSQAIGADENNVDDVRISVRMALWTLVFLAPPLWIAFFFATDIALALGQPEQLAQLAGPYVLALAPGWLFAMGTLALRNFLAAIGEARAPLIIVIGTTLTNAFFNWLLIYGHWGFPKLELVGAGIASSLAHMCGFIALALYIRFDKRARRFDIFRDVLTPHWARFRELIALAWPIGAATAFEGLLFNSCVFLMGRIGVNEVAAYQVALNVAAIAFMAPLGLSMAGCVRVGLAAGAGDKARVRRAAILTVGASIAAIMCVAIPVVAAPEFIAGLYLNRGDPANAAVLDIVAKFLVIAGAFMLFDATQVSCAQALRGLKDVRWPMVFTGVAYWAIGFPAAAYLGLATDIGAPGVWWGLLISLFAAATMLGGRLYLLTR